MLGYLKGKTREPSPNLVSSRLVYRALGEMIDKQIFTIIREINRVFAETLQGKSLRTAIHEEETAGDYAQRSCGWRLPSEGSLEACDFWQQNKGSFSAITEQVVPWKQALQESQVRWCVLWAKE